MVYRPHHRRHQLRVRRSARPPGQGHAAALGRPAGGNCRRQRRADDRGADGAVDVPLGQFLEETVIPFEDDEVTRLIIDGHDAQGVAPIAFAHGRRVSATFCSPIWRPAGRCGSCRAASPRKWPPRVSKLMRNQDLILVARKMRGVHRLSRHYRHARADEHTAAAHHPFDDARGITASILDGLLLGSGDACIGINPARRRSGGDRRTACDCSTNSFRGSRFRPRAAC